MVNTSEALFHVSARLSVPAAAVLAGALVGAQLQRRLRRRERERGREPAPPQVRRRWWRRKCLDSNHWCSLSAHVVTLLCAEVVRSLYHLHVFRCPEAVTLQNCIELSGHFWLHVICLNFILSFRDCRKVRDSYTTLLFSLAYAWFIPTLTLTTIDLSLQKLWVNGTSLIYDTRTCFLDAGSAVSLKENDASLQLATLRGISILITSTLFLYIFYKIGYRRQIVVLCPEDAPSMTDLKARQSQALKYILSMAVTGFLEITCDLVTWYFTFHYSRSVVLATGAGKTTGTDAAMNGFLFGQWVSRSISFCVDFLRVMLVCEVMCWGGPLKRPPGTDDGEENPPCYEMAAQMPPIESAASAPLAPPPTYSSIFGERLPAEDSSMLTQTSPSQLNILKIRTSTV